MHRGLGSLADLAKILEEASNPESEVREDRKENKPKAVLARKGASHKQVRALDPKRKLWYEKRLREQAAAAKTEVPVAQAPDTPRIPAVTRAAASRVGGSLLESLAAAKDAKPRAEGGHGRTEAWRRKPGDPIF
jgi:hypothetical protein